MLSAAGFEKNKLFTYVLNYIAKRDSDFQSTLPIPIPKEIKNPVWNPEKTLWEEAIEENKDKVSRMIISLDDMRLDIGDIINVGQVEHFLLFIFLRNKKETLSEEAQKKLISDWNNVCDFKHTHTTIAGDIQFYVKDSSLAISLWHEFEKTYKDIPIEVLHEICLYVSTKNMDGTYCYYVNHIGVMGNHIITTNMIKDLTRRETVLKYIGKETSNRDIKRFMNRAEEFLLGGLEEKYNNIFELLTDMLIELKSWLKDPTFIFYDYATRVPGEINVVQNTTSLSAYKALYEKTEE